MVATTGLSLCMMIGMFCFITFMLRPLWTTRPDMLAVFIEKQLSLILLFISFYSVFPQLQMSINREKSNGLFATIMATPLTFQELIFGKSFFYFCMGYLCGIVVTVFYMIFLSYLMGGITLWNTCSWYFIFLPLFWVPILLMELFIMSIFSSYYFKNTALIMQIQFVVWCLLMTIVSVIFSMVIQHTLLILLFIMGIIFIPFCLKLTRAVVVDSIFSQ